MGRDLALPGGYKPEQVAPALAAKIQMSRTDFDGDRVRWFPS
jgi:hypothetical protein